MEQDLKKGHPASVVLVGLGCGTPATMTAEGRDAVQEADVWIGARRLLEGMPSSTAEKFAATKPGEILSFLLRSPLQKCCVLYGGDTGFYSGTRNLVPLLEENGIPFRILPGISSVQVMAARLCRPWQEWKLVSAHGVHCDAVTAVREGKPALFLTGGSLGPSALCLQLDQAGLGSLPVTVGENLSYDNERILHGTAREFSGKEFAPLSVLLAEPAPKPWNRSVQGIDDREFLRGDVPMTKQEVRACALAKLEICSDDILWDVGAGTGSVSVEMALSAGKGHVYAVECEDDACSLIQKNREKFGAWNLTVISGKAPEVLEGLPVPDAVFLGGTKGGLAEILNTVYTKNPEARVVVSAITVETLSQAVTCLAGYGRDVEITQVAVSRSKNTGRLHMMTAQNPVFLISAGSGRERVAVRD